MKNLLFFLFAGLLAAGSLQAQIPTAVTPRGGEATVRVKNPNPYELTDAVVVLSVADARYRSARVTAGGREIPSQFDVFDDGTRELALVIGLKAGQRRRLRIEFSENEPDPAAYPARTFAEMFLLENRVPVPMDEISADQDNMDNRLYHHGPALESEQAAYRVYFDRKQTVDPYGKVVERLELADTRFYPTVEQMAEGYGADVLIAGESVGIGAMKGWDGERSTHIRPMARRTARVLARGPVRAIVEMNVEGWEYNGRHIDMSSRYTIYAGHRDAMVLDRFSPNAAGMEFSTGVQKILGGDRMETDGRGRIADWGRWWPEADTVKYNAMQTVGLGISMPRQYIVAPAVDELNYLYVVTPDANHEIRYRITFGAEKESFGYKTAEEFFAYVRRWHDELPVVVTVES
jgi:hypothetical protein